MKDRRDRVERRIDSTTLTRERVLAAAVALADEGGIEAVSMRKLGQEVGLEAMSLYTHVRGKDDLLAGMVETVVGEIGVTPAGPDWKADLRWTVLGARAVILRHPWAPRVMTTRPTPGPEILRYLDGVMGILRGGGLSVEVTHHALHVMGSRLLGFTQDLFDDSREPDPAVTAAFAAQISGTYPHVAEMAVAASHDGASAAATTTLSSRSGSTSSSTAWSVCGIADRCWRARRVSDARFQPSTFRSRAATSGWPRRGGWRERPAPELFEALRIVRPTVRLRWSRLSARQYQRRWLPPARRVALDREAPPGRRAVQAVGDDRCAARVDHRGGTARIAEHVTLLAWRNPLRVMSRTQRRAW